MKLWNIGRRGVCFLALIAVLFGVSVSTTFGAEPTIPTGSFVVRPAKVELAIAPGGSETRSLTLTNSTALPLSVKVSFEDVAPRTQISLVDDPIVLLGADGGEYPLRELVSTKEESVTILSGTSVDVPITIRIPKNTTPGGHYGSVVFTFTPIFTGTVSQNENVAIESRLATLFFVRVTGEAKEEGGLIEFGLFNNSKTTRSPTQDTPLRFQVAFENTGTVHLNPYGRISIAPIWGKSVVLPIDPWAVLPSGTRMREINLHDSLSIGYYTATIEQNRGYQDIVDTREVHFWVMPSSEESFIIILITLLVLWLIRRSLALSKHAVS